MGQLIHLIDVATVKVHVRGGVCLPYALEREPLALVHSFPSALEVNTKKNENLVCVRVCSTSGELLFKFSVNITTCCILQQAKAAIHQPCKLIYFQIGDSLK